MLTFYKINLVDFLDHNTPYSFSIKSNTCCATSNSPICLLRWGWLVNSFFNGLDGPGIAGFADNVTLAVPIHPPLSEEYIPEITTSSPYDFLLEKRYYLIANVYLTSLYIDMDNELYKVLCL